MKKRMKLIFVALSIIIASCAVITVNIYFPEKDVKEAYRSLEKELMTPDGKNGEQTPPVNMQNKPESFMRFEFVSSAYAQESGQADKIADMVKRMPDVVNAYRDMGARIGDTDRLRDSGAVGEGKDGMLVPREGTLSSQDKDIVKMENEDRKTVIKGMTKAIIRINRQPDNEENMNQLMPQATEQFASIRRDSAKKGWWIQSESGNWAKK